MQVHSHISGDHTCSKRNKEFKATSKPLESPHVRESTKVLDSGSQSLDSGSQHLDSGFQLLDSGFQNSGFRIPYQSSGFRIPNHCGSGFQSLDSGFQQQKFAGFRIPDSLTWGDSKMAVWDNREGMLWLPESAFPTRLRVCQTRLLS